MLIVSKYKDYYDGVVKSTGVDKSVIYDRKEIVHNIIPIFFKKNDHIIDLTKIRNKKDTLASLYVIGFCGKLYVGAKIITINSWFQSDKSIDYIYDIDLISNNFEIWDSRKSVKNIINIVNNINARQIFIEYNTPVFIYDLNYYNCENWRFFDEKFIINPPLNKYKFYKIFDTYQAFQEISMFISNILVSDKKIMVDIEDKYKIEQHGFDKWSFRKESQNEKGNS